MRATQEWLDAYLARSDAMKSHEVRMQAATPIASPAPPPKATLPKYGNRKVTDAEGNVHDSTKEYRRWLELQLREVAGEITELRHHVPFVAVVEGEHICDYEADFTYREGAALIVEDVKPKSAKFRKTLAYRHFRLKQKLVQAIHKFQIREV